MTLYLLMFISIPGFGFGQCLVSNNKVWSNLKFEYLSSTDVTTETFRFTSDSLINGLNYKVVEVSKDESQSIWSYYGLIREDSNKRVYFRLKNTNIDRLFYDFNLGLNDTITVYTVHSQNNFEWVQRAFYKVHTIDSMLIGDRYRRRINLSDTMIYIPPEYWEHWIDSTGNLGGLFHNFDYKVGGDGNSLLCFTEDGLVKYINPAYSTCFVITDLNEDSRIQPYVDICPNPVINYSLIRVTSAKQFSNLHIRIFNLFGATITSRKLDNYLNINHNDFSPGLYLYQIIEDNCIIQTGKIQIN